MSDKRNSAENINPDGQAHQVVTWPVLFVRLGETRPSRIGTEKPHFSVDS